ncbi:DNA-binding transcriptional MerR regulator [Motilibacter rhizosphaerae]|uniref:DNA-binding transcriptional MerR regulator n=1 Tax=Motilibacter rhizosphaerae TaxID=598652 RepID=A0A4Q7NUQ0_9ACTN|nr:MerR family transcriptional regulator [Motilibacter rhizosphaerae]RZS90933.1 DNA-binding transcriptional MerR regulator [Motilibacter rhizosphaerae]
MSPLPFDDPAAPLYSVGQVAGMLAVQPAFLRRLDTHAVVSPARSDGGQRRYSRHQVEQLQQVCALVDEGVTLPGVRHVLGLRARVAELEAEVARLRRR